MDYSPLISRVIDLAIEIQQIPGTTFAEQRRAEFVYQRFKTQGLQDVSVDHIGNVYARLPGTAGKPPLVITAHSDTVFPETTDLTVRRQEDRLYAPGIGDNSLGVAGLFGLLWWLGQKNAEYSTVDPEGHGDDTALPGDLWLVANVGEEGLGDLCGMRAVVDRFGDGVLAYLVLEGMALGQVYHRALGVKRYRIEVRTQGGHSWVDYGCPSAIHELSTFVTRLIDLSLPEDPRTTLNVGVIEGGTSVNTIAADAHIELDLRSEDAQALSDLAARVEEMVSVADKIPVSVSSEVIGQRPAGMISTEHPLIRLVKRSLEAQGIQPVLSVGSTDANVPLSRDIPAVCLGLTTGSGAHTLEEYINIQPIAQGMAQLVTVVVGIFEDL